MTKDEIREAAFREHADSVASATKRLADVLDILAEIPEDVSARYRWGTFIVETEDKAVFSSVAKAFGETKVEKYVDEYRRTGALKFKHGSVPVYSSDIPLPETCTFRKETRSYEVLVPEGNCGSWFSTDQQLPEKIAEDGSIAVEEAA